MVAADQNTSNLILVSGPSRGGKSRWAEHLLSGSVDVTYVATAPDRPDDQDWQIRLEVHRRRRPSHWRLLESDADLTTALRTIPQQSSVLIDALGGFVACHLDDSDLAWNDCCEELVEQLAGMGQTCVVVIEETGWGVVPPTRIGGRFRDRLGSLAQILDRQADSAWLVLQGRAVDLHALSQRVP